LAIAAEEIAMVNLKETGNGWASGKEWVGEFIVQWAKDNKDNYGVLKSMVEAAKENN
jgi:hypothetical protein